MQMGSLHNQNTQASGNLPVITPVAKASPPPEKKVPDPGKSSVAMVPETG